MIREIRFERDVGSREIKRVLDDFAEMQGYKTYFLKDKNKIKLYENNSSLFDIRLNYLNQKNHIAIEYDKNCSKDLEKKIKSYIHNVANSINVNFKS